MTKAEGQPLGMKKDAEEQPLDLKKGEVRKTEGQPLG